MLPRRPMIGLRLRNVPSLCWRANARVWAQISNDAPTRLARHSHVSIRVIQSCFSRELSMFACPPVERPFPFARHVDAMGADCCQSIVAMDPPIGPAVRSRAPHRLEGVRHSLGPPPLLSVRPCEFPLRKRAADRAALSAAAGQLAGQVHGPRKMEQN